LIARLAERRRVDWPRDCNVASHGGREYCRLACRFYSVPPRPPEPTALIQINVAPDDMREAGNRFPPPNSPSSSRCWGSLRGADLGSAHGRNGEITGMHATARPRERDSHTIPGSIGCAYSARHAALSRATKPSDRRAAASASRRVSAACSNTRSRYAPEICLYLVITIIRFIG
jgi:hypothetical protein